jgi:chaperonin GroES
MKIQPLGDRVVVRPISAEQMSKSGIVIPDTAKEKPQEGEVVAVGQGRLDKDGKLVAVQVKVGDRVMFTRYGGDEFKLNDEEVKILREDEILGVIIK